VRRRTSRVTHGALVGLRGRLAAATPRRVAGGLLAVVHRDQRAVYRWALAIIVAGVVARVGWAAWIAHAEPLAVRSPDTPGYVWPARALIEAGRFSLSPTDPTPMFVRTPGYPAFLAAIMWVTGSEWAISPIQAALSAVTVVTIVLVGRRLMGVAAGLVAGALVVLDPLQFMASGTILTEGITSLTIAAIAAVGVLVFALRTPDDVHIGAVFGLGALVAVATMVRPTMWFYPAVLLVLLAIRFRSVPRRALVARLLVFLLPIVVVVGGWQYRNHSTVDSWQLSGATGLLLYCSNAAQIDARTTGTSMDATQQRLGCPESGEDPDGACTSTTGWTCRVPDPDANGQGFDEWNRLGLEIMADHPVQTARIMVEGVVRQVAGAGTDTVRRYFNVGASIPLASGLFLWNATLWGLAAVGAVAGLRSRHRAYWAFVIATVGYVIIVSTGDAAGARYRVPAIPMLALLAAHGIQYGLGKLRSRERHPATRRELQVMTSDAPST
jgi:4-amino-4-deoxy-L-arabinose transferase-like glycosyltransferase